MSTVSSTPATTTLPIEKVEKKQAHTESSDHKEPTLGQRAAAVASVAEVNATAAARAVGAAISSAASSVSEAVSKASQEFEDKHHVKTKSADVAAHVHNALAHGHPVYAAKYASAAAVIGDAERHKHEAGPLPEGAMTADSEQGVGDVSRNITSTSSASTGSSLVNQAKDAASFSSAALAAGNPVHAVSNVGAAVTIGEAERQKKAMGNLEHEADIAAVINNKK